MSKPLPYIVEWIANPTNEPDLWRYQTRECQTLQQAKLLWLSQHPYALAQIMERSDIRDVTPKGDPRGILWDYDERVIEEAR